jgi:hypothetical protein
MIYYDVAHSRPDFVCSVSSDVSGVLTLEGTTRFATLSAVGADLFSVLSSSADTSWTCPSDVQVHLSMLLAELDGEQGS